MQVEPGVGVRGGAHLILVFGDVGIDLMQGTHAVELAKMQSGLLCQVGAHVLITDGGHLGNVSIVPDSRWQGQHGWGYRAYPPTNFWPETTQTLLATHLSTQLL